MYYWDTYISLKYEQQTRELLTQRMEQVFGKNCYVEYVYNPNNAAVSGPDGGNRSFEEYIAHNGSLNFGVIVNYIPENGDEIMAQVKEALADIDAYTLITFRDAPNVVLDEVTAAQLEEGKPALAIISYPSSNAEGRYREYKWRIWDLYKEETTTLAKSRIEQAFGPDCFVNANNKSSCEFVSIPTFEEYIATPANYAFYSAIVRYSIDNEEEILEKVETAFDGLCINGRIYVVNGDAPLNEESLNNLYLAGHKPSLYISTQNPDTFNFSWRK